MKIECIVNQIHLARMGIYTITVQTLEKIHEVKGRFWIKAEFREHETMWTTYDEVMIGPNRLDIIMNKYNIPQDWYKRDGTYIAVSRDGLTKTVITNDQHYILKFIIWKYLMYSDRYDLLTDDMSLEGPRSVSTSCTYRI